MQNSEASHSGPYSLLAERALQANFALASEQALIHDYVRAQTQLKQTYVKTTTKWTTQPSASHL